MTYCHNCGNHLIGNSKYCPSCGTKIINDTKENIEGNNVSAQVQNRKKNYWLILIPIVFVSLLLNIFLKCSPDEEINTTNESQNMNSHSSEKFNGEFNPCGYEIPSLEEIQIARNNFTLKIISQNNNHFKILIKNNSNINLPYLTVKTIRFDNNGNQIGWVRKPVIPTFHINPRQKTIIDYYPLGYLPNTDHFKVEIENAISDKNKHFFIEFNLHELENTCLVTIDGQDIQSDVLIDPLTLWDNYEDKRKIISKVRHGSVVHLIDIKNEGALVRDKNGNTGWLNKNFFLRELKFVSD